MAGLILNIMLIFYPKARLCVCLLTLGAIHKRRPQSEGVFQMRMSAVFGAKNCRIFWNLHFVDGEVAFCDFVRTSLLDGPLCL